VSVEFDYPGEAEAWEEKVEREIGIELTREIAPRGGAGGERWQS